MTTNQQKKQKMFALGTTEMRLAVRQKVVYSARYALDPYHRVVASVGGSVWSLLTAPGAASFQGWVKLFVVSLPFTRHF
jgi:uncharacterized protein YfaA (DUF2138 family)